MEIKKILSKNCNKMKKKLNAPRNKEVCNLATRNFYIRKVSKKFARKFTTWLVKLNISMKFCTEKMKNTSHLGHEWIMADDVRNYLVKSKLHV